MVKEYRTFEFNMAPTKTHKNLAQLKIGERAVIDSFTDKQMALKPYSMRLRV
jgi:hypothetical protein